MTIKELASRKDENGRRIWTRERLAVELGVSFSTVRNWESGMRPSALAQKQIDALIAKERKEGGNE